VGLEKNLLLMANDDVLGREIQEETLKDFISDANRIESYIKRGKNEIRWHSENKGFFELVEILLENERESIKETFQKISENYTNDKVQKLVIEIDDDIRREIAETKLTLQRKQFIIKLLTARFDKQIHCKFFHCLKHPVKLSVKAIDQNGRIRQVFMLVEV
jgi:hypothetical protein